MSHPLMIGSVSMKRMNLAKLCMAYVSIVTRLVQLH